MDRLGSLRNQRARQLASVALISTVLALVAAPRADALAASADLRLSVDVSAPWVRAGTDAEILVRVTNRGPDTASGVTVRPTLDGGLDLLHISTPDGSCLVLGLLCELGDIEDGTTETLRLVVGADSEGKFASDILVDSETIDPDLADNVTGSVLQIGPSSSRCTMRGTPGRDRLRGTPGRDVICALAGRDTVRGLDGSDLLIGGRGKDRLLGGLRADRLRGGKHADTLRGGRGRDRLTGGPGRDDVGGGPGRDRCGSRDRGGSC